MNFKPKHCLMFLFIFMVMNNLITAEEEDEKDPIITRTCASKLKLDTCYLESKTIENGVEKVLFLCFDDVETEPNGMRKEDAEKVAEFIKEIGKNYDVLVVHCDAGISRSSGVAAAIMKYLYNNDAKIFDSPMYQPNMRCYRLVLDALHSESPSRH